MGMYFFRSDYFVYESFLEDTYKMNYNLQIKSGKKPNLSKVARVALYHDLAQG